MPDDIIKERRLRLQSKLEKLIGSRNVYFQSPPSVKMKYPAIRYSRVRIESRKANNEAYTKLVPYEITFIHANPDDDICEKMMNTFHYCRYDRRNVSDNLYHDIFTLYY